MLLTVLAKEPAFPFCSLEAECETLMKSNLHLWMAMKRSPLFAAIEKPCPHTARSKTCPPHHQPAPTLCPSPSTLPGTIFRLHQPAAIPPLCCVAKSTCWESFHQPLSGVFQSDPRAPTTLGTHTPKIRQMKQMREKVCVYLNLWQVVETSSVCTSMYEDGRSGEKVNNNHVLLAQIQIMHPTL